MRRRLTGAASRQKCMGHQELRFYYSDKSALSHHTQVTDI